MDYIWRRDLSDTSPRRAQDRAFPLTVSDPSHRGQWNPGALDGRASRYVGSPLPFGLIRLRSSMRQEESLQSPCSQPLPASDSRPPALPPTSPQARTPLRCHVENTFHRLDSPSSHTTHPGMDHRVGRVVVLLDGKRILSPGLLLVTRAFVVM